MVKQILATRELTVNIEGKVYDVLLIPRDKLVDVDYSKAPELDPTRQQKDKEN